MLDATQVTKTAADVSSTRNKRLWKQNERGLIERRECASNFGESNVTIFMWKLLAIAISAEHFYLRHTYMYIRMYYLCAFSTSVVTTSTLACMVNACTYINRNPYNYRVKLVSRNQWVCAALSDPRHLVRVAYCTDNRINGVPECDPLWFTENRGTICGFLFVTSRLPAVGKRNSFVENWLDRRNNTEINALSLCNLLSTPAIKSLVSPRRSLAENYDRASIPCRERQVSWLKSTNLETTRFFR